MHWSQQTLSSNNTRYDTIHRHHHMVNTKITMIIFFAAKEKRSSLQSAKTRPGADYGSDHELIAKFRLKLKKVGKTTRPFRYDLNQILHEYTVKVTNKFKGLDLIECLKNNGQRFLILYRRQWSRPSPKKEMQKGKMVVWIDLTNSWEKKRS